MILAAYLDDCWEPSEAHALLDRLAKRARGTRSCLRVAADGAQVIEEDGESDDPAPGAASYLWVLWSGQPPTLGEMLALHEKHVRVTRIDGGARPDHGAGSTTPRRSSSDPSIL